MNLRLTVSRVALGAVVALSLVTQHAWDEHGSIDKALGTLGDVLLLAGCAGRIWCALYIAGRKNKVLVDRGPYSLTRNPLYLFSCLAFIGAGLSFESFTLAALFGIVFFATHWPTIHVEEHHLRSLFGATFDDYAARVPRFLPRFAGYQGSELLEIRPRVFTRTLFEASLIPLVYLAAQAIERGHEIGVLPTFVHLY
ncbi:MAG: isoprenylcysteine carboxylmethyltransferase family protein [Planctomycetaceae bacterium]|nr:isoprenylcysteine carboxylmethyltransferase family protein [Planctomycetaceae bacterium]